jgi:septal ring factor EnvC (AmiA/AmiB activator)
MFLAWLIGNYKIVGLLALILSVAGYVTYLRADVKKHELEVATQKLEVTAQKKDIDTLKADLGNAKVGIENMKEGMNAFQIFVNQALDSMKVTQGVIASQNKQLQRTLDNLAVLAAMARRIVDAPTIPFFMGDNVVIGTILVGIDNGAYRYRLLPEKAPDH